MLLTKSSPSSSPSDPSPPSESQVPSALSRVSPLSGTAHAPFQGGAAAPRPAPAFPGQRRTARRRERARGTARSRALLTQPAPIAGSPSDDMHSAETPRAAGTRRSSCSAPFGIDACRSADAHCRPCSGRSDSPRPARPSAPSSRPPAPPAPPAPRAFHRTRRNDHLPLPPAQEPKCTDGRRTSGRPSGAGRCKD